MPLKIVRNCSLSEPNMKGISTTTKIKKDPVNKKFELVKNAIFKSLFIKSYKDFIIIKLSPHVTYNLIPYLL